MTEGGRRDKSRPTALAGLLALCAGAAAVAEEVDFFDEVAALAATQSALAVAAEGSALAAVERGLDGVPVTPRNRAARDRLTDLLQRQTLEALRQRLRSQLAAAMTEEQAAALADLHSTPEGAALIEAVMLATLALRQEGAAAAEFELGRAERLMHSIIAGQ